ncbi:hypothetical protein SNE25_09580 [Mucilaginibacter sabulilitoris]|uniref:DUF4141 domain-containing protein n=1 Tax=Mucilaginibacter sabulilitoris TaxID=1173583 RepID=A0ABZ0TUD6_9SPHI|nr:hypothetical protein [Mucilaginibacter sabulilitoris]WPU95768.1 hypothetical protein SNE25_09580 [Mucilaginibacter sabulilitoris]
MKKNEVLFICCCLTCSAAAGQAIYADPTTAAAMSLHSSVINAQLNKTNDKLTMIGRGQLAVTGQLTAVNDVQQIIYKGLSEVASALRSLLAIKDIADIGGDIITDIQKATAIARTNPALLLFAENSAREFKNRTTNLAAEVGSFILAGGHHNLMDSGERAKLLNRIVSEMMIIRGVVYGMYRSMYWARERGIFNSLDPYAGFVNTDNSIADDILGNSKLIIP